jgi:hypothetical protein
MHEDADERYGIYLTVDWNRSIKTENIYSYKCESGQSGKGVDLLDEKIILSATNVSQNGEKKRERLLTHIVHRCGRRPRITFHSKSRVVRNSQL